MPTSIERVRETNEPTVGERLQNAWEATKEKVSHFMEPREEKRETISETAKKDWELAKEKINDGVDATKKQWEETKDDVSKGWEATKDDVSKGWESTKENVSKKWEDAKDGVNKGLETTKHEWQETKDTTNKEWIKAKETAERNWEAAKERAQEADNKIYNELNRVTPDGTETSLSHTREVPEPTLGEKLQNAWESTKERVSHFMGSAEDTARDKANAAKDTIDDAWLKTKDEFHEVTDTNQPRPSESIHNAAKSAEKTSKGFIESTREAFQNVANKVTEAAQNSFEKGDEHAQDTSNPHQARKVGIM